LDKTGVLKGFMIFLTATLCPVSWSLAELDRANQFVLLHKRASEGQSYQTRPNAPIPTGWRSEYLQHQSVSDREQHRSISSASPAYLDVISKVVPKIWARTNSAMMEGRSDCVGKELVLMS
jgi:hypothetical protein